MRTKDLEQIGRSGSNSEWIYGVNPVFEAIKAGRRIKQIYISTSRRQKMSELLKEIELRNIDVIFTEPSFFDKRFGKGHQGIAASVYPRILFSLQEMIHVPIRKNEIPFFIVIDCIEDPRNLGAILRIADAAGVHGLIMQSHRSASISSYVSKASAGAIEYVPISIVKNIKYAIEELRNNNIEIIGAEEDSETFFWDVDFKKPLALVVGSEGKGLRRIIKERCDIIVKIPMFGNINSLNVSVATGILAFEILRQRLRK